MRTIFLFIGAMVLSLASMAQQGERQMQKPDAVVKNNGTVVRKASAVNATPAAPRQMAPLGSQPAVANTKAVSRTVPANSQPRQMTPLNPNTVVKKSN